jgi:5'-nucleotidase/UDP-sugar diphosphatase
MKKLLASTAFSFAVALGALGGATGPVAADEHISTVEVTFMLVNDIYELGDPEGRGGFSKLNGTVIAERAKGGNVIYVHAGDMISPSLFSGFDKGAHTIELTNLAAPDIFVPGNHEFDFGEDVFRQRMDELNSTIMAANLRDENGAPIAGIIDTEIREVEGVKIGFVGLTSDESPLISSPGNLQFTSAVETGIAKAGELREAGADLVVAITHSPRPQDQAMFGSGAFDIILTGHDHDLMVLFDGRTAMIEASEEADFVSTVDVTITVEVEDGDRDVDWWPNFRIIDTLNSKADPATAARVVEYKAELSRELDVEIGTTATPLDSRRASVRSQETSFGDLVADGMRAAVGADIAITNGGGIRGNKEYPAGSALTRRDILTELPFGNLNLLLELSGADVAAALENGVSRVEEGDGRFPQVSNLTFDLDLSQEPGSRVSNVTVGGTALDKGAMYKLATNDFMARGGNGYSMFKTAKILLGKLEAKLMANDVMVYIREAGTVSPRVEGRINQ